MYVTLWYILYCAKCHGSDCVTLPHHQTPSLLINSTLPFPLGPLSLWVSKSLVTYPLVSIPSLAPSPRLCPSPSEEEFLLTGYSSHQPYRVFL